MKVFLSIKVYKGRVKREMIKNGVYREGGLYSTEHLSQVGTLLMPVESSQYAFLRFLFVLPFVPDSMGFYFFHIRLVVPFYSIFLLGH